jgi:hypothetical protein
MLFLLVCVCVCVCSDDSHRAVSSEGVMSLHPTKSHNADESLSSNYPKNPQSAPSLLLKSSVSSQSQPQIQIQPPSSPSPSPSPSPVPHSALVQPQAPPTSVGSDASAVNTSGVSSTTGNNNVNPNDKSLSASSTSKRDKKKSKLGQFVSFLTGKKSEKDTQS